MSFNFLATVDLSKRVLPIMKKQKQGAIINITSIYGRESGGKATVQTQPKQQQSALQNHWQSKQSKTEFV